MVSILRPGQWVVQNVQTSVQPMVSWSTRSHASWNLVEMMITTKCASLEFKKGHDTRLAPLLESIYSRVRNVRYCVLLLSTGWITRPKQHACYCMPPNGGGCKASDAATSSLSAAIASDQPGEVKGAAAPGPGCAGC